MFNRDKNKQLEQYYAGITTAVIQAMTRKYARYLVSSSNYDTGGVLTEPWKRHITFIFKSADVHKQVKGSGVWAQLEADTRAALAAANTGIHDEKLIELSVGSADIDAINGAGGYYYYFK